MLESELTAKFTASIPEAEWIPIVGGFYGKNGSADRVCVHPKIGIFFIEFKGFETPIKQHQLDTLQKLCRLQAQCAFIVRGKGVPVVGPWDDMLKASARGKKKLAHTGWILYMADGSEIGTFATAREVMNCIAKYREDCKAILEKLRDSAGF